MSSQPSPRTKPTPEGEHPGTSLTPSRDADLGVLLTLALATFKDRLHQHLAQAGFAELGPSYGFVFRTLAEKPHNLAELAARLEITPQGALKIVTEMIDDGYVERRDDDKDKRVRWLSLTTRGKDALQEARKFHASVEQELIALLGNSQMEATRTVLATIATGEAASTFTRAAGRPF